MKNFIFKNDYEYLSILVCTICNHRCSYCTLKKNIDINTNYDNYFDPNILKLLDNYEFDKIKKINIQGGEPGLLTKEELDLVFNYLKDKNIQNNKIYIFTNGLFLEKYLDYYKDFNYVYHVIDFNSFIDYFKYNLKIRYIYIIYNYECLSDFEKLLKNYSYINFELTLDVNLDIKNISDEFFNKLKYLVNNFNKDFEKEMFINKKKFSIISSILIRKQLNKHFNNI